MTDQTQAPDEPVEDPVLELLRRMVKAGGRMQEREVHRLAREIGLAEDALERLWHDEPKVLDSEDDHRVVTRSGRERLNNLR